MCIAPVRIATGELIACRNCYRCRQEAVNDWVGRALCEAAFSSATLLATFTYRGAGPETAILTYPDIQKCLKRLRRDGFKVRYIVAGEYGSLKGRAHWHVILFFRGRVPDLGGELGRNVEWPYWPHGFTQFKRPDAGGFRYVLKYLLKYEDGQGRKIMMSKKPPIGDDFLRELAEQYARAGVVPQDWLYEPPAAPTKKDGTRWRFHLSGVSRRNFVGYLRAAWERGRPGEALPDSEALETFADAEVRAEQARDPRAFDRAWERRHGRDPATVRCFSTRCGRGVVLKDADGTIKLLRLEEPWSLSFVLGLRSRGATESEIVEDLRARARQVVALPTFAARLRAARGHWQNAEELRWQWPESRPSHFSSRRYEPPEPSPNGDSKAPRKKPTRPRVAKGGKLRRR